MKTPGRRPHRVAEAIRETVAPFLQRELRDPRITGLVTVTVVTVTPDLKRAVVGVAVHGDEAARQSTLEGLVSAAGLVRREIARALRLRSAPEVVFEFDEAEERATHLDAVLASLRRGGDGSV